LRERRVDTARHFRTKNLVPMLANDTDDGEVVRRTIARRLRITNVLPERVATREKLLRHHLVDDQNTRRVLVFCFRIGEIAATQESHTHAVEPAGRDGSEKPT